MVYLFNNFERNVLHIFTFHEIKKIEWSINYELAFLGNDAVRTKHDFYQIAGFPNVLGAVDGSLIPIIAPNNNEPEYVCRKGFHAINIQVVADASLRYAYRYLSNRYQRMKY